MTVSVGEGGLGGAHLVQGQLHSLILSVPFHRNKIYVRDFFKKNLFKPIFIQVVTFWQCKQHGKMDDNAGLSAGQLSSLNNYSMKFCTHIQGPQQIKPTDHEVDICGFG